MDAKVIAEVIAELSAKTLTAEHSHMLKPWEMVFGGLVLPMLAEVDESVKADPKFAALTARYSKAAVEKFFATHEVERVAEKIVMKPIYETKTVERNVKVGGGAERTPTLHDTVELGGKFRRLKDTVNKIARKQVNIPPEGLDAINTWWNLNQKLADDGDCQHIADAINLISGIEPLSAAQVSGWLSWLCRLALKVEADLTRQPARDSYIAAARKRGKFNVAPLFTGKFIIKIANNKLAQATDRADALRAKVQMKAEVARSQVTA